MACRSRRDCFLKWNALSWIVDVLSTNNSMRSPLSNTLSIFSTITALTCSIILDELTFDSNKARLSKCRRAEKEWKKRNFKGMSGQTGRPYFRNFSFDTIYGICIRFTWEVLHLLVKHSGELIIHRIGQSCECHSPISFHKSHVNILEVCKGNSSCNDSVLDNRVSYIQELDHQPFNPAS